MAKQLYAVEITYKGYVWADNEDEAEHTLDAAIVDLQPYETYASPVRSEHSAKRIETATAKEWGWSDSVPCGTAPEGQKDRKVVDIIKELY